MVVLRYPKDNVGLNPFALSQVRQVVSMHLIDRETIARDALKGNAVPMMAPVFRDSADYPLLSDIIDRFNPHFDPELGAQKLSQLLSEMGARTRGGKLAIGGNPISVVIDAGEADLMNVARVLTRSLERAGFDVAGSSEGSRKVLHLSLERIRTSPSGFQLYTDYLIGRLGNSSSADKLMNGDYSSAAERIGLIRTAVESSLADSSTTFLVAELDLFYYNSTRQGVENVAYDRFAGPDTYWFYRTVKLRDFMWNGWLRIGVPSLHSSPYDPFGGFEGYDRAIWMAVSDPPGWPHPRLGGWYPMRVNWSTENATSIPSGSWRLEIRDGMLYAATPLNGRFSKLTYSIRMSDFHDGEHMTAADLIYGLYHRLRASPNMAEGLEAIRILRDNEVVRTIFAADVAARIFKVTTIELYLSHAPRLYEAIALAPYSAVPWELYVLTDSSSTPSRRIDLVDDVDSVKPALERMRLDGYVPPLLRSMVSAEEARTRWSQLSDWANQYHNLLVANGPYYLDHLEIGNAVLKVFRDFTYPFGIGDYDHLASAAVPPVQKVSHSSIQPGLSAQLNVTLRYSSWPLNNSRVDYLIFSREGQLLLAGPALRIDDPERIAFKIPLTPGQTALLEPGDLRLKLVTLSPDTGGANATESTITVSGRPFALAANWIDVLSYTIALTAGVVTIVVLMRSRAEAKGRRRGRR